MRYRTFLLAFTVRVLASALQLDLHRNSKDSVLALDTKPLLRSRDDEQGSLLLFRRIPTKSNPTRKNISGSSNLGLHRSQSHPDLSVIGGRVRAKPEKAAGKGRQRLAKGRLSLGSLQGSQSSGSTDRIDSRTPIATEAESSSSSGRMVRSQSSSALSSSSFGERGFAHESIIAHSPGTSQSSLRTSSRATSREQSLRSQRNSIDDNRSYSAYHSNQGNAPTTPRSSILSSAGIPSPLGSSVTQSSRSGATSTGSPQRLPSFSLLRIHDSPSSIPRGRAVADPDRPNTRTSMINSPGFNQIRPESPVSRIDSTEGEIGSSRGAPSDRGVDAESLNSLLQRLRFGRGS